MRQVLGQIMESHLNRIPATRSQGLLHFPLTQNHMRNLNFLTGNQSQADSAVPSIDTTGSFMSQSLRQLIRNSGNLAESLQAQAGALLAPLVCSCLYQSPIFGTA